MRLTSNCRPTIDVAAVVETGADALLLDLDGTLTIGEHAVCGADRLIANYADRFAVITNNSSDLPETIAQRLAECGLSVPASRIFTAGMAMIEALVERQAPTLALVSSVMRARALERGVLLVDKHAHTVAIGRDAAFNYPMLTIAANEVRHGARLVASNLDNNHPGSAGTIVPETGALVAAILAAAGSQDVEVIGKPSVRLAELALDALGCSAARSVVVGDNPATDGALAASIGSTFVPVIARTVGVRSASRRARVR